MIRLLADPMKLTLQVFRAKYDHLDITVDLVDGLLEETGCPACCCIPDASDEPIDVQIDVACPLDKLPELLAHELAHAVLAREDLDEQPHGPAWEEIFRWAYVESGRLAGMELLPSDLDKDVVMYRDHDRELLEAQTDETEEA